MPALILCNRKWLAAGDDLLFFFFIETFIRVIWVIFNTVILCIHLQDIQDCREFNYVTFLLFISLINFIVHMIVCIIITKVSARGSIMQVEKRSSLPNLMMVKFIILIFEIVIYSLTTWYSFSNQNLSCVNSYVISFLEVASILSWIYFGGILLLILIAYDPIGSPKFWKDQPLENITLANLLKKSKKMWENRLKFVFCCSIVRKRNRTVYKDIANFFSAFCKDIDLVPSDVLAGLVVLSKKHASEKRRLKFLDSICNQGYVTSNDESIPSWMSVENALHFLRLAKSTYGWIMFFDKCNPCSLCVLTSRLRCCVSSRIQGADTCCHCNAAALQKVTGFHSEDLIYVSYHNNVHEPAFFVVIDREKSCVVIGIRGTLSLSDIVTDIDGESETVKAENCSVEFQCHRGTLKSARYIYQKLEELKILKCVFSEVPNFKLVVTGHSLGGSIAAVLCFMLRPKYPDLQCYIYGPLAVLSANGTKLSYDFIFTIIVGDDMSPRLCIRSCVDLRSDVVKCLQECTKPKYKLLLGACVKFLFNIKIFQNENDSQNFKNFDEILKDSHMAESKGTFSSVERLYAPGRILYLEYTDNGVRSCWKTGFHFQRLIITPRIMRDHQPHRIQSLLESFKTQQCEDRHKQLPNPFYHNESYVI